MLAAAAGAWFGAVTASQAAPLYDDLGGHPGLVCVVDHLFVLNLADPRISAKFDDINIPRLKSRIADDLCTLTGGPCHFKGVSMKGAHRYLHLHELHFNALVENLQASMDHCGVGFHTQNRLLAILAPMERDIVSE